MQTIRVQKKTGNDGTLHLDIPLNQPDREFEVVVVVHPNDQPPEAPGWPPGYFEKTFGSITDESFVRPPQGKLPEALELE